MRIPFLLSVSFPFYFCLSISNSCSQHTSEAKSIFGVYETNTPCEEDVLNMLHLAPNFKCDMLRWKLTLYKETTSQFPSSFDLACTYGSGKQGTRGFTEEAKTLELNGKCTVGRGTLKDPQAIVYTLVADNINISLTFFRPDQNLLHLLAVDKSLMVGNAGFSYTFNRKDLVSASLGKFIPKQVSQIKLNYSSSIVGIFGGRFPCNNVIKNLQGITSSQCNLIKCQLTLFQDSITHLPAGFNLSTIYVGFGDNNRYNATGTWKILQGTVTDSDAIVYLLQPEKSKPQTPILLQKADDNVLFFLDNDTNLLRGNEYCAYTLSRTGDQ